MATFGERLKALRKNAGIRQQRMVDELNELYPSMRVSQTTISALEQRDTAPREDVLSILADYFNLPITYFFEQETDIEARIERAKLYLSMLSQRTYAQGASLAVDGFLTTAHMLYIWQPDLEVDEYLEQ